MEKDENSGYRVFHHGDHGDDACVHGDDDNVMMTMTLMTIMTMILTMMMMMLANPAASPIGL